MSILLNRGSAHLERGSLDVARVDLERCVEVAVRVGQPRPRDEGTAQPGLRRVPRRPHPAGARRHGPRRRALNEGSTQPDRAAGPGAGPPRSRTDQRCGPAADDGRRSCSRASARDRTPPRRSWRWPSASSSRSEPRPPSGWRAGSRSGRSRAAATPGGSGKAQMLVLRCERAAGATRLRAVAARARRCSPPSVSLSRGRRRPGSRPPTCSRPSARFGSGANPTGRRPGWPTVRDTDRCSRDCSRARSVRSPPSRRGEQRAGSR